jgi:hypothetical protein
MDPVISCKEYCYLRRLCYANGEAGLSPAECPNAWRIEEIMADEINDRNDEEEDIDE